MGLSYLDLVVRFKRMRIEESMSSATADLYHYLLGKWNDYGKKNPVAISNEMITGDLDMEERSMKRARARLIELGLISYSQGGAGKHDRGKYIIVGADLIDGKGVQKCTPNTTKGDMAGVPLRGPVRGTTKGGKNVPRNIDIDIEEEKEPLKGKKEKKFFPKKDKTGFVPPTLDEVKKLFEEIGKNGAENFFNYNEARGWKHIRDWRAIAKLWRDNAGIKSGCEERGSIPNYFPDLDPDNDEVAKSVIESLKRSKEETDRKRQERHRSGTVAGDANRASRGASTIGRRTATPSERESGNQPEMPLTRERFAEICRSNGIEDEMEIGRCLECFKGNGWNYMGVRITSHNLDAAVDMWKHGEEPP